MHVRACVVAYTILLYMSVVARTSMRMRQSAMQDDRPVACNEPQHGVAVVRSTAAPVRACIYDWGSTELNEASIIKSLCLHA